MRWCTTTDEDRQIDQRAFELINSGEPYEDWTQADKQTWAAFLEGCKRLSTSRSLLLAFRNEKWDTLPTEEDAAEALAHVHLRDWALSQDAEAKQGRSKWKRRPPGKEKEFRLFVERWAKRFGVTAAKVEAYIDSALDGTNPEAVAAALEVGFLTIDDLEPRGKA
jgi:hypothetical protein